MVFNHGALREEWERMGKPQMEFHSGGEWHMVFAHPCWNNRTPYRFANDPHWELRQKWVDSGKTLPIEVFVPSKAGIGGSDSGAWGESVYPSWHKDSQYREALYAESGNGSPIDFHPLQDAFGAVISQVTKGKGQRHGGDSVPFFEQPWYTISKQTGLNGLVYQGMKKAGEACGKQTQEDFERELLGAIAYLGMSYLFVKRHGFKPEVKVDN
jgi:hypothetical protein